MKANEFVKKFGWEVAATDLRNHEKYGTRSILYTHEDLKRLIRSHSLVADLYGLERAKKYAESDYAAPEVKVALKQAIADVESCQ